MHIIVLVLGFLVLISCVHDQQQKVTTDLVRSSQTADQSFNQVAMPEIAIEDDVFDFGEMNQYESITTEFILENIGDAPLLIRSAKGSCGCTVADWPREPVGPGKQAAIRVTFNSENKQGEQNKVVTLVTNAIPSTKVLTIKGTK